MGKRFENSVQLGPCRLWVGRDCGCVASQNIGTNNFGWLQFPERYAVELQNHGRAHMIALKSHQNRMLLCEWKEFHFHAQTLRETKKYTAVTCE
jgi:hypothetical protein